MSIGQSRLCLFISRGKSLLSRPVRLATPATFEGQRKLSTDSSVYTRPPFPYKTKRFNYLRSFLDFTSSRLNENSRIILIEGPPYVGKTEFAKNVAKEFHMEYIPPVTDEDLYFTNGFDERDLNEVYTSDRMKCYDIDKLYNQPDPTKIYGIGETQLHYYAIKFEKYIEALLHVLHTGQGVVMENSVWSDGVYGELLYKLGYYTRNGFKYYKNFRTNSIPEIWKPHLVIHLDAPTSYIMEQMKKTNPEYANSPVFNERYINIMQQLYKEKFLPYMNKYSEVLSYDVTDMPEFDLLSLDLEKLDLIYEVEGSPLKFADWRKHKEEDWSVYRLFLSSNVNISGMLNQPKPIDAPEIVLSGEEAADKSEIRSKIPELKYSHEFFYNKDGSSRREDPLVKRYLATSLMAPAPASAADF